MHIDELMFCLALNLELRFILPKKIKRNSKEREKIKATRFPRECSERCVNSKKRVRM